MKKGYVVLMEKVMQVKKLSISFLIVLVCSLAIKAATAIKPVKPPGLLDPAKFLVIAHRGSSFHAPEHTMAAYRFARDMEADYLEIDLQMTKDGVLVALHDFTVDRTTNGSGTVTDMTLAEIKELDAGSWFNKKYPDMANAKYIGAQIPTFQEIINEFGYGVNYYLETKVPEKNEGIEDELLALLEQNNLLDDSLPYGKVIIQSFNEHNLRIIHRLNPSIPLIQLERNPEIGEAAKARMETIKEYAVGIGTYFEKIDEAYLHTAASEGLLVHLYTINNADVAEKWKALGANGLFTDNTSAIKAVQWHA
ncbi:glycerophosphodiester phosphodiesterase family protein [Planococcus sp. YIM B11945]|uniref:glycerophosphodiester phosphodiesterase family protein n=1 Tax=Planococcus sp. YIM B11945 TaxID=3435410 RepID=UPI003D7E462F